MAMDNNTCTTTSTTWDGTGTHTQTQPNPLNPSPPDPYAPTPSYTFFPQNPNPNSVNQLYTLIPTTTASVRPSDAVSYASIASIPHSHVDPSTSGYYQIADVQNWAAAQVAVGQYGADPGGHLAGAVAPLNQTEQVVAVQNFIPWMNQVVLPYGNGRVAYVKKKAKVVQSAYCDVCKVDCNSNDVLQQHKLGKKHIKNVEKLKQAMAPPPAASASPNSVTPVIGPQENPNKGVAVAAKKVKKRAAESPEDLELKKRKVLECGADATAVRTCTICNVVCNSDIVFQFHLSGQKHTTLMKKHLSGASLGTPK